MMSTELRPLNVIDFAPYAAARREKAEQQPVSNLKRIGNIVEFVPQASKPLDSLDIESFEEIFIPSVDAMYNPDEILINDMPMPVYEQSLLDESSEGHQEITALYLEGHLFNERVRVIKQTFGDSRVGKRELRKLIDHMLNVADGLKHHGYPDLHGLVRGRVQHVADTYLGVRTTAEIFSEFETRNSKKTPHLTLIK